MLGIGTMQLRVVGINELEPVSKLPGQVRGERRIYFDGLPREYVIRQSRWQTFNSIYLWERYMRNHYRLNTCFYGLFKRIFNSEI